MKSLTCTQVVTVIEKYKNSYGKRVRWHRKCNRPANRIVLQGLLTTAEAVLCWQHQKQAEAQLRQQWLKKKIKRIDPRQMNIGE